MRIGVFFPYTYVGGLSDAYGDLDGHIVAIYRRHRNPDMMLQYSREGTSDPPKGEEK